MAVARKLRGIVLLAAVAGLVAGCGAKESNHLKVAPTETKPGDKLRGTYKGRLTRSDLPPKAPHKLAAASPGGWTLTIAPTGGPPSSSTPTIRLANSKTGVWEKSRLGVETDTLLIHDEFCKATQGAVDSLYRYKLDAGTLRISKYKNGCKDNLTQTVLTSHPWKKQGG
jgi:hypothetical protein